MEKAKMALYRVYGQRGLDCIDEYVWEESTQKAVDHVRSWHEDEPDEYTVKEVSKVVHNWK